MAIFSPALEERFRKLLEAYPVKRSALVPMLLYAQDELGWLTPEAISAIAARLELPEIAVRETIGYYTMLRTQPAGRYHVQVCTNISCLLRGGNRILEHCRQRLGEGPASEDGVFSLEEVECMGACSWAPAIQVNYDFFHDLTPERVDRILEAYRRGAPPQPDASYASNAATTAGQAASSSNGSSGAAAKGPSGKEGA